MSEVRFIWRTSGAGVKLILVNLAAFLLLYIPDSLMRLMNGGRISEGILHYLKLPGAPLDLLVRPWTIFTHMFVHVGLAHVLFNMITLFFAYQLFSRYLDDRRFINTYFAAGLAGALMFLLSVNIFPVFEPFRSQISAAGSSAATLGVMAAVCFYRPGDRVMLFGLFSVQLRWIAITFILLDILQISQGNEAGHLAHLGGALYGFIWSVGLKRGNDFSKFFNPIQNLFSGKFRFREKRSQLKVKHRKPISDEVYNESKAERQRRIDEILDKISRSGYDSLSKEEKAILFEYSNDK